jgi:hypothetical protein
MVKNYLFIFCNYFIKTYHYFKKTKKNVSFSPNDNLNKYYNNFHINYHDDNDDEYYYYIDLNYAYYNHYYKNKDYNHKNDNHNNNDKNDYGYFIFIE